MTLTPDQKRILLILCDASERAQGPAMVPVKLRCTQGPRPIRETTTAAALVRKGLATRLEHGPRKGHFQTTLEGFWMGDALRIEDRLGKIPARR